jgi:hypothetical protein
MAGLPDGRCFYPASAADNLRGLGWRWIALVAGSAWAHDFPIGKKKLFNGHADVWMRDVLAPLLLDECINAASVP